MSDHTPLVDRFESRITLDLDGKNAGMEQFAVEAIRSWHNLQEIADRVDVHVSTGQHGLHMVGWFEESLEMHEQLHLRRGLGDDPRRTDMDEQRWMELGGRFTDVLFQQKADRNMSKERRFRDVHDALDYIRAQRKPDRRMKRLAIDGHKGAPDLARRARGLDG